MPRRLGGTSGTSNTSGTSRVGDVRGAGRVSDPAGLDEALAECLAAPGPYFLDVRVPAQENCFPMIPAGCGHQQILLSAQRWYEGD